MKRILCIWLPNWPIQRIVIARPELKSRPVVLHTIDSHRKPRVVACSRAARQAGVRVELPLAEAVSLLERHPPAGSGPSPGNPSELKTATPDGIEEHRPQDDRKALEELAMWCHQFSPLVGWETVASTANRAKAKTVSAIRKEQRPDFLFLDVTGLGILFGGETRLAERVAQTMHARDYYPSVSIASCPGAAWALARWGRFASTPSLPRYRVWVEAEEHRELGGLPVEALRTGVSVVETLRRLGVRTVDHLEQLPRRSLQSRFGSELLLRWRQLRGEAKELISPYQPPKDFRAAWDMDPPTHRRDNVEEAARQLVSHIAQRLRAAEQGAVRLRCIVRRRERDPAVLQIELFQPTCNAEHLFSLLKMQLESFEIREAVTGIEIDVAISSPLDIQQSELFDEARRGGRRELPRMLDRLATRLGQDRVLAARTVSDPLPERAVQFAAVSEARSRWRKRKGKSVPLAASQRPLRLYSPPQEILTTAIAPEGPPVRFRQGESMHRVVAHWGPERIETGWWRGAYVRRDYYRVETESGTRFWLFRNLRDNRWFLHGEFV